MEAIEKIKTDWEIPAHVRESFVEFCGEKGVPEEDCAGALVIWQYLPVAIRKQAKLEAKGFAAGKKFWNGFRVGIEFGAERSLRGEAIERDFKNTGKKKKISLSELQQQKREEKQRGVGY